MKTAAEGKDKEILPGYINGAKGIGQEIDRQHHTIPNQSSKDRQCWKI